MPSRFRKALFTPCRPYERALPGGGFVAIDITSVKPMWRSRVYAGAVVVERRVKWRRAGHTPPVIARASGTSVEAVVQQLLPAAQCNSTIGGALLRRGTRSTVTHDARHSGGPLRLRSLMFVSLASLALANTACRAGIDVRTMAAPDVRFATPHTFHMLPGPARRDGRPAIAAEGSVIVDGVAVRP